MYKKFTLFWAFAFLLLAGNCLMAQQIPTPGLIVVPVSASGQAVLDPNNDGYVSDSTVGFLSNDVGESEIPFVLIPGRQPEPTSDLATGPSCGFTDLVNAGSDFGVFSYFDGANLMFRFRLGNIASNAKGYSILIDTDGYFGFTGPLADGDAVIGNPGFELEIEYVSNFGVRLYNANGTATPTQLIELAEDDYSQRAVAITNQCGNPDYFYDFYMPLSVVQTFFPAITASTPLRMVGNTVISTQSALRGPISDINGVIDSNYGNTDNPWIELITGQVPTPLDSTGTGGPGYPPLRATPPVVSGPISSGATTVNGTSVEAVGSTIYVYVDGVPVDTVLVLVGGTWTATTPTLSEGQVVSAKVLPTGKSLSNLSNEVTVGATCSSPPTTTCNSAKGIGGNGPAGAPTGTTIRIYASSNLSTPYQTVATTATNTWLYNCAGGTTNCTGGGPNCLPDDNYFITAQEPGKCESTPISVCQSFGATAATPVITTNPINPGSVNVTGTATSGTTVYLFVNGYYIARVTATGGNWNYTHTFVLGDVLTAQASSGANCLSAAASRTVTAQTTPPVVKGPINVAATSISGTSVEAAGTLITVYRNSVSIGTTTVDAYGNWTLSGLNPALLVNLDVINATATATGKSVSGLSNNVTVRGASTPPVITGSYTEGGTSVSGTSVEAVGSVIKLFIDGTQIGTTTVLAGGTWTVTGLSPTDPALYTGGVLSATVTATGENESGLSNLVTVQCVPPLTTAAVSLSPSPICSGFTTTITVNPSEPGVIYTLRNNANTANLSTSRVGNNGPLQLVTQPLTASARIRVQAMKLPSTSCTAMLTNTDTVTVNPIPLPDRAVTPSPASITSGNSTVVQVGNTQSGVSYQLRIGAVNVGTKVVSASNGSTVNLATGNLTSSTTFNVLAVDENYPTNCSCVLNTTAYVDVTALVPLEALLLRARRTGSGQAVLLDWTTRNEVNVSHMAAYELNHNRYIGTVQATGNTMGETAYRLTDLHPQGIALAYRVVATDMDGSETESNIVELNLTTGLQIVTEPDGWKLLPPAENPLTDARLTDLQGRTIAHGQLTYIAKTGLAKGWYLLQCRLTDGQTQVTKLWVE